MAAPRTTLWELEPHSAAKHAILRRYIAAWIPILSHGNFKEILYIDAFAGPGRYVGGEDGSPIIALKELSGHGSSIAAKTHFHFVELDSERADFLERLVKDLVEEIDSDRPGKTVANIHRNSFEEAYPAIKRSFQYGRLPATFAFIDAFGWTGFPFQMVIDILSHRSCEVLINFMYEEINRFIGLPEQDDNFDRLFGCSEWRNIVPLKDPRERNKLLRELYANQLRRHAKYVRSFEMRNKRSSVDYHLFFATNNLKGLEKMKESMWKADASGEFSFSDATDDAQLVMFGEPNYGQLRRQILDAFKGREASIEQITEYVLSSTAFRETHFKAQILKVLESETPAGLEIVRAAPNRKRGSFPPGTVVRFP